MVLPFFLAGGMVAKDSLLQLPVGNASENHSTGIQGVSDKVLGAFFKQ